MAWALAPSLARRDHGLDAEMALIKRFQQDAVHLVKEMPQHDWDWLFLMRHHGVPTRLLDWSESPLVGLYFAVEDNNETNGVDGMLWCLDPYALNELSGFARPHARELPCFVVDEDLDLYLPKRVKADPPHTRTGPAAAIAQRRFLRLYAQFGVFTIAHRDVTPLDRLGEARHVWRYVVPADRKEMVRRELALLGLTRVKLFPELEHLADVITQEVLG